MLVLFKLLSELFRLQLACSYLSNTYKMWRNDVVDSETGEELKSFNHVLCRKQKVDFVEQFNEKLLVKQGV